MAENIIFITNKFLKKSNGIKEKAHKNVFGIPIDKSAITN